MIHHISLGTNDLFRARRFYDAVMPILGLRFMKEDEASWHYGIGHTTFSIIKPVDGLPATAGHGTHIAFELEDRDMVDAFYRAALDHGGSDCGAPGTRPEYDANYYAAFIKDPDGNKLEAVTYSSL